jgi:hypothetical protein
VTRRLGVALCICLAVMGVAACKPAPPAEDSTADAPQTGPSAEAAPSRLRVVEESFLDQHRIYILRDEQTGAEFIIAARYNSVAIAPIRNRAASAEE